MRKTEVKKDSSLTVHCRWTSGFTGASGSGQDISAVEETLAGARRRGNREECVSGKDYVGSCHSPGLNTN